MSKYVLILNITKFCTKVSIKSYTNKILIRFNFTNFTYIYFKPSLSLKSNDVIQYFFLIIKKYVFNALLHHWPMLDLTSNIIHVFFPNKFINLFIWRQKKYKKSIINFILTSNIHLIKSFHITT